MSEYCKLLVEIYLPHHTNKNIPSMYADRVRAVLKDFDVATIRVIPSCGPIKEIKHYETVEMLVKKMRDEQ